MLQEVHEGEYTLMQFYCLETPLKYISKAHIKINYESYYLLIP